MLLHVSGQVETPGPVMIASVFVGYKVAGLPGSILAIAAVALPSFLMTIAAAGQLHRSRRSERVQVLLRGVSPAVVGMLIAAGLSMAQSSVVDVGTGLLTLACLVALVRFKADASLVVVAAGAVGLLLM